MKPTILFDGVCNLCNDSVNYVIDHDPEERFRFGSLQSEGARQLLGDYDLPEEYLDSMILIDKDGVHVASTAALRVARHLSGPARWLSPLLIVPRFLRDAVYAWVARNRYRWFGKRDACRVPTPELRARFL